MTTKWLAQTKYLMVSILFHSLFVWKKYNTVLSGANANTVIDPGSGRSPQSPQQLADHMPLVHRQTLVQSVVGKRQALEI